VQPAIRQEKNRYSHLHLLGVFFHVQPLLHSSRRARDAFYQVIDTTELGAVAPVPVWTQPTGACRPWPSTMLFLPQLRGHAFGSLIFLPTPVVLLVPPPISGPTVRLWKEESAASHEPRGLHTPPMIQTAPEVLFFFHPAPIPHSFP